MRLLLHCVLAASLLLTANAIAAAQAGRYIPIPVGPAGGVPFHPHVPLSPHAGEDSSNAWITWIVVIVVLSVLGAIFEGTRDVLDKGKGAGRAAAPVGDVIRAAWEVAPRAEHTHRLMEFLAHRNSLFEPSALRRWVEQRFLDVQDCWQKADYGPLGGLLMPAIRAEHERQLAAMRFNGERNVLRNLSVQELEFVHLDCPADADRQEFTALITFRAASYYVDARTGAFRRGSQVPTSFQEFWVFCRKDDAWHLAWIERSHVSTRLARPNHVEQLTEEQRQHAEECIAL
jgi:hypothetical protein